LKIWETYCDVEADVVGASDAGSGASVANAVTPSIHGSSSSCKVSLHHKLSHSWVIQYLFFTIYWIQSGFSTSAMRVPLNSKSWNFEGKKSLHK
jgi:hypothetical protein